MEDRELDRALEPLRELLRGRKTVTFRKGRTFTGKNKITEVFIMASFDFESLKKKITDTASTVVEKTTVFAKDVASKSGDAAKNLSGKAQAALSRRAML